MSKVPQKFGDIEVGGYIYIMNPIEKTITPLLVTETRPFRGSDKRFIGCIVIGYYLLKPIPNVTLEKLVDIQKENGKEIKIGHLITVPSLKITYTTTTPPILYAITEDELKSWAKIDNIRNLLDC